MLEINPNNSDAHFALGYIYRYAGMEIESIEQMKKSAAIDPKNQSSGKLSLTYSNLGEYKKALDALEIMKGSLWAIGMKIHIYYQQGKYKLALEYIDSVINIEPNGFWGLIAKTIKHI